MHNIKIKQLHITQLGIMKRHTKAHVHNALEAEYHNATLKHHLILQN